MMKFPPPALLCFLKNILLFHFCCFDGEIQREINLKVQKICAVFLTYCLVQDGTCFNKTRVKVGVLRRLHTTEGMQTKGRSEMIGWWHSLLKTFSFTLFSVVQSNKRGCQCSIGCKTITYSIYVLMAPSFTFRVILSFGACSRLSACAGCAGTPVGEPTFIIIILWIPFIIIKYVSIKGMGSSAPPTSSLSILTDKNLLF